MLASTINIILFFLAAGIPLLINPLAFNSVELIKRQSAYALVCLIALCAIAAALKKNPLRLYALPIALPLLLFALSACLATVFSVNPDFSLHGDPCRGESLFTIITYVLLSFIFAFFIQSFEQALSLIRALCIATAILCLYGIIEFLCLQEFGISPLQHFRPPELRQPFISGTMGNSNFFGRYLVLVLPLFAAFAINATTGSRQFAVWAGGGVLAFTTLVLTYSRASVVGIVVGGLVFVALTRSAGPAFRRRLALLFGAGVVLIAIIGLISQAQSGSNPRTFFSTLAGRAIEALDVKESAGLGTRLFTWQQSIPVILERPWFGHGPDTGFDALEQVNFETAVRFNTIAVLDHIHNNYLDIALTQGLIGLGAYLAILFIFMRGLLHTIRAPDTHPEVRILLCGLFSGFAGCLVNDFFTFSTVSVSMTFWSLIGIGYALQNLTESQKVHTSSL